ncbi:MAG: hypothetical protein FD129_3290, partial [bacterium]
KRPPGPDEHILGRLQRLVPVFQEPERDADNPILVSLDQSAKSLAIAVPGQFHQPVIGFRGFDWAPVPCLVCHLSVCRGSTVRRLIEDRRCISWTPKAPVRYSLGLPGR